MCTADEYATTSARVGVYADRGGLSDLVGLDNPAPVLPEGGGWELIRTDPVKLRNRLHTTFLFLIWTWRRGEGVQEYLELQEVKGVREMHRIVTAAQRFVDQVRELGWNDPGAEVLRRGGVTGALQRLVQAVDEHAEALKEKEDD